MDSANRNRTLSFPRTGPLMRFSMTHLPTFRRFFFFCSQTTRWGLGICIGDADLFSPTWSFLSHSLWQGLTTCCWCLKLSTNYGMSNSAEAMLVESVSKYATHFPRATFKSFIRTEPHSAFQALSCRRPLRLYENLHYAAL